MAGAEKTSWPGLTPLTAHAQLVSFTLNLDGGGDLWYDDVSQCSGQSEELQCVVQAQRGVVLRVVLDAVVDVGDLADVVAAALHAEVPLQLGPALQHQLQGLAVVQLQVCP